MRHGDSSWAFAQGRTQPKQVMTHAQWRTYWEATGQLRHHRYHLWRAMHSDSALGLAVVPHPSGSDFRHLRLLPSSSCCYFRDPSNSIEHDLLHHCIATSVPPSQIPLSTLEPKSSTELAREVGSQLKMETLPRQFQISRFKNVKWHCVMQCASNRTTAVWPHEQQ